MSNTTLVTTQVQPEVNDPAGHTEAMIAKFDGRSQETPKDTLPGPDESAVKAPAEPKDDRPGWLPEGFNTPEEFAEAYKKLSTKPEGQPDEPVKDPATTDATTTEGTPTEGATKEAEKVLEDKGLDYGKYQTKFNEKGTLEDADYAELEAKGIPRSMVDDFIEGQKARAASFRADVLTSVGGEQGFAQLTQWARTSLSADEINAFNDAVTNKPAAAVKLALEGLNARYVRSVGSDPRLLQAPNRPAGQDVYESVAQMRTDMGSKEYKTDPAFRAKVQAKLARSNIL